MFGWLHSMVQIFFAWLCRMVQDGTIRCLVCKMTSRILFDTHDPPLSWTAWFNIFFSHMELYRINIEYSWNMYPTIQEDIIPSVKSNSMINLEVEDQTIHSHPLMHACRTMPCHSLAMPTSLARQGSAAMPCSLVWHKWLLVLACVSDHVVGSCMLCLC